MISNGFMSSQEIADRVFLKFNKKISLKTIQNYRKNIGKLIKEIFKNQFKQALLKAMRGDV